MTNPICEVCSAKTKKLDFRSEYFKCIRCNTLFNTYREDVTSYKDGHWREEYVKYVLPLIHNDIEHYKKLKDQDQFKQLAEKIKPDCIHSFAGAHPKLESMFDPKKIRVYDVNADLYEAEVKLFCEKYSFYEDRLSYFITYVNKQLIDSIKFEINDMAAFVHFFEHIPVSDVVQIIDAIPLNIPILVYQPNADMAKDNGWTHFHEQHLWLATASSFVRLMENHSKIEIITQFTFSDDFLIVFKKVG